MILRIFSKRCKDENAKQLKAFLELAKRSIRWYILDP